MLVYFFVYIFAIYFIYSDKRDCEIFSHAEYVTRPEHVLKDLLIINFFLKCGTTNYNVLPTVESVIANLQMLATVVCFSCTFFIHCMTML